ncbi:hypothetical protein RMATCC62417_05241 [Rhizopus microsporus]|nr:hypothetical protein RMATCC62417_05241 [Rhizopus microsporus]
MAVGEFICYLVDLYPRLWIHEWIRILIVGAYHRINHWHREISIWTARFGPSLAGAIQTATNKNSFLSQELFTGLAFILSALITLVLKYNMNNKLFAKI